MKRNFLLTVVLLYALNSLGQSYLKNGSFEGERAYGTCPAGWEVCDYMSTPDIQPGAWNVHTPASKGNTYIGLVTRLDDSWETISQSVNPSLQKDECYYFNIDLARSDTYIGFNKPVKLLLWGGNDKCEKKELLTESDAIEHLDWETYTFTFSPKENFEFIIMEVYYENLPTYQGNMLIDELSPFYICENSSLD